MSRSSESGDDMEAGRANRANHTTKLWAEREEPGVDFAGDAMLIVEASPVPEDKDDWEDDDGVMQSWRPSGVLSAIIGIGWSGTTMSDPASFGGTGVIGIGGRRQGTGVFGRGGGEVGPGVVNEGGFGVHGIGGSIGQLSSPNARPGIGVVGQGGAGSNEERAPGVVGLAAGTNIPPAAQTDGVGTFGAGRDGVFGVGESGAGVRGHSDGGNGGLFSSVRRAQLQLNPLNMTDVEVAGFRGQPGELLCTITADERGTRVASLWFCKSTDQNGLSNWVKLA